MPGQHGGQNTDEKYAPHMYIGGQYVGSKVNKVRVGKWIYRVGQTGIQQGEGVIAERWSVRDPDCRRSVPKLVANSRIPVTVRNALISAE